MDEPKVGKRGDAPMQATEPSAPSSPPSPDQHELSDPSAFLDAIIENIPHMIFVKDAERLAFSRFNRAGEELLGMPRSALLGKTDHDFWPPEQVEHFIRKDRETLAGGKLLEINEEPIQTARGLRWLRTKKIPLRDSAGVPRFLLGISEDITEQKLISEELQRTRDELEQRVVERTAQLSRLNAELSQEIADRKLAEEALRKSEQQLRQAQKLEAAGLLAGGVAHDFNNLLTVIAGYAEALLNDAGTAPSMKDDLTQISRAAEQATTLTRQLLAFSRRQVSTPEVLDLNAIITELEKMLRRLIGEHIVLALRLSPKPALIKADPGQIEQVILNLVVNARDAIENGGQISLESSHVDLSEADRPLRSCVMLTVRDTGQGMDEATRARIFEPFFTTKERGRGTGLGLATVFGIVEQSGGSITVHSEPGFGSTFKVYLPATPGEISEPPATHVEATLPTKAPIRVLLVEDEEMVRSVARRVLEQHHMQVVEAENASVALTIFHERPADFDVVVSDVVMPGMNGPALIELLLLLRPDLKVLYMSGYANDALVNHDVVERGFVFLQKPFAPPELVRKVRELAALGIAEKAAARAPLSSNSARRS
ncbi:MAG TPA: ATP-binding protein [Polyangiaceae bacterium]|nr:ATP-binding protein [Polyangiaceae bacterium]